MPSGTSSLTDLANAHGVATHIRDASGRSQAVAPRILEAVLTSLGVDVSADEARSRAVDSLTDERWSHVLPPTVVMRESWTPWVPVRVLEGDDFEAHLELEDGTRVVPQRVDAPADHHQIGESTLVQKTVELPGDLPLGYHELVVTVGGVQHRCPVIVTPATMTLPATLDRRRGWGVAGQLYAVRSDRSWGIGDAADLAELGTWAARSGADFVNVGPVNAGDPVPTIDPNPYRPVSRLALDPLAIRVEEIREIGYLSAAEHQLVEWHGDDARRLNLSDEVDRDAVWESKRAALRMIFRVERSHRRRRDVEQFAEREAAWLADHATWCILAREHGPQTAAWPQGLKHAGDRDVEAFRAEHAEEIEFEAWMQWVATAQFADAQREVTAAGMRIGVMHDVAPGVITDGLEQWAEPDAFASGVHLGARDGDGSCLDLGLAALKPASLARDGYARWRQVLRRTMEHSGAVRVDRIGMLFRQWWIPQSTTGEASAQAGTFVHLDHEALVGILLLEAHRAGVVVVAGDEGVTAGWIRDYLTERGLISSASLWDVPTDAPAPDPKQLPKLTMSALGPKDAPPGAALLSGAHLEEVRKFGLGNDHEAIEREAQRRRAALVEAMTARGLIDARIGLDDQVNALHRHLASAPSVLITVRVADLVGDSRIVGEHGVTHVHALWRRPIAGPDRTGVSLDDLMTSRRAKRVIHVVRARTPN